MKRTTKTARCIFAGILAAMFLLPLVQMRLRIIPLQPLRGVQKPVCFPEITMNAVRRGEFQAIAEKWFARNFGLREFWIRLHNQILYTMMRTTPVESTIDVGENGQLFEKNYIEYHLGIRNPCTENLQKNVNRLAQMRKMLLERGISLIVCISPSKAAFDPNDIPWYYDSAKRTVSTTYRFLSRLLNENRIPWIDGPGLLRLHRNDMSAPLFPLCSSHWNSVGAFYSADRFITVAESLTNETMNHPCIQSVRIDSCPVKDDLELAHLLNVFWTPADFPVMHPMFGEGKQNSGNHRPRLLVEGGSFNWIWLDALFRSKCLESAYFYYYYSKPWGQHYFHSAGKGLEKIQSGVDWERTIRDVDIVVIEINESLMNMFPVEFIHDLTGYLEKRG
jgi:alginate O-acetyltransferase complex protein AlgJ